MHISDHSFVLLLDSGVNLDVGHIISFVELTR